MVLAKQKKAKIAEALKKDLGESKLIVLAHYRGMSDKELYNLRVALKAKGCSMKIAKNTVTKIAISDTQSSGLVSYLKGPNAILFSKSDPISLAKVVDSVTKTNENLKVVAGCMDSSILKMDTIRELAKLGSLEDTRASFVGLLVSAQSNLIGLLTAAQQSTVALISGYADSKK